MKTWWLVFALVWSGSAGASNFGCAPDLDESLEMPPGFGISTEDMKALATEMPEYAERLLGQARLARFIVEDSDDFFEHLGTYYQLGFAKGHRNVFVGDFEAMGPQYHRRYQLDYLTYHLIEQGMMPVNLGEMAAEIMTTAFGPLDFAEPFRISPETEARFSDFGPLKEFARANPVKVTDLMDYSQRFQHFVIGRFALAREPDEAIFHAALRAWRDRRQGLTSSDSSPASELILADVAEFLKSNCLTPEHPLPLPIACYAPPEARKFRRELALLQHAFALVTVFREALAALQDMSSGHGPFASARHDPIYLMTVLNEAVDKDMFIDSGVAPMFRKAFAEILFRKPVLSGSTARRKTVEALKAKIGEIKRSWRELRSQRTKMEAEDLLRERLDQARAAGAGAGPLETSESREARLKAYREPLKKALAPPPVPRSMDVAAKMRTSSAAAEAEALRAFWADIADKSRDIDQAREVFKASLVGDRIYRLPILKTGFVYRVEFSPELIDQLLNPRGSEPEDLREWIEALQIGPAGRFNQRGWRKDEAGPEGKPIWKIKLRHSMYRMVGHRLPSKVWRFEWIGEFH